MKQNIRKGLWMLLILLFGVMSLTGCTLLYDAYQTNGAGLVESLAENQGGAKGQTESPASQETEAAIDEDGEYYSKDEVALYIYTYQKLPSNYITKKEAQSLGWEGGAVENYAPEKVIGGDHFGNYEGLLPEKSGRSYTECDIDTKGKSRGAKRIVFSNDGLIYYTDDHYESFTLLYGEE